MEETNTPLNPDEVLSPRVEGIETENLGAEEDADYISQPAKVMRIVSMVKTLLEEARSADLDEAGRKRLKEIYSLSIDELSGAL